MSEANSKIENYSYSEIMDTLAYLKAKYPSVYRWFFIWEMEKLHGTREGNSGLDQEQKADSGSS